LKQRALAECYPPVLFRSESKRLPKGILKINKCNTSKSENSILQQIICHDLAQLKGSNSFQCKARLEKESPVPRKLAAFLKQHFGRNPANSATCNSAFLDPAGKCQRKDVVVLKNSELCVAHIWFHASFDDKIVSLVSLWEIQEFNKHQGHATCKKVDDAVLIDTSRSQCSSLVHAYRRYLQNFGACASQILIAASSTQHCVQGISSIL